MTGTVSSAERAWSEPPSSGAATATVAIPSSRQARNTRRAISPRLATSTLRITAGTLPCSAHASPPARRRRLPGAGAARRARARLRREGPRLGPRDRHEPVGRAGLRAPRLGLRADSRALLPRNAARPGRHDARSRAAGGRAQALRRHLRQAFPDRAPPREARRPPPGLRRQARAAADRSRRGAARARRRAVPRLARRPLERRRDGRDQPRLARAVPAR